VIQREGAKTERRKEFSKNIFFASLRCDLRVACAFALILFAFLLRIHNLGAQSLWYDEGNSYVQATRSFSEIAVNAARDIHPPGYYWLLAAWRALAGETEFALRFPSALASLLTVVVAFAIGKRLYGVGAGLLASVFVTLNTFSLYYAQETRMYAPLALWGAAGMWTLILLLDKPTRRRALALGLINAAGLWTQYAYPFFMLVQGVVVVAWLLTQRRGDGKAQRDLDKNFFAPSRLRVFAFFCAANLLAIFLYLPWLPTAYTQITTWPNTGEAIPFAEALGILLNWLTFGITARNETLAVALILLLFGLVRLPLEGRRGLKPASNAEPSPYGTEELTPEGFGSALDRGFNPRRSGIISLLLPAAWVLVPVGVFLAAGLFREANLKFLLPTQIGYALWLARGAWVVWQLNPSPPNPLSHLRGRGGGRLRPPLPACVGEGLGERGRSLIFPLASAFAVVWLLATMIRLLTPLYDDPAFQRADYRTIAATIATSASADDAIILNAPNQEEVFRYYYRGDAPIFGLPPGLGGDDATTRAEVERLISQYQRAYVVFYGEAERDPNRIVETTLDAGAFEMGDIWFGDVRLSGYAMPAPLTVEHESGAQFGEHITLESAALNAETFAPGDVLQLRLNWQTDAPLTTRYKVFVHLLDAAGVLAAQRDSEPGGGLALTTTWTPGETVEDNHALLLPTAPGDYQLCVGLYDLDNPQARLPVSEGGGLMCVATITIA
jgi:mannosyltransferase